MNKPIVSLFDKPKGFVTTFMTNFIMQTVQSFFS